jgi:hypothetical protein
MRRIGTEMYAKESLIQGLGFCSASIIFLLSDSEMQRRMGVGRQEER